MRHFLSELLSKAFEIILFSRYSHLKYSIRIFVVTLFYGFADLCSFLLHMFECADLKSDLSHRLAGPILCNILSVMTDRSNRIRFSPFN